MTTHDIDIELPPLPEDHIASMMLASEVRSLMRRYGERCALAAIEPYAKRIAQLEAARFAYASEFPPNEDGDPDVGSIHENIRKLKADRKRRGEPADVDHGETRVNIGLETETGSDLGGVVDHGEVEPVKVPSMIDLIADDAYAATFQSVGQYRKALLARYGGGTP